MWLSPRLSLTPRDSVRLAQEISATVAMDRTVLLAPTNIEHCYRPAGDLRSTYHQAVRRWIVREARPGDTVLIMGARDPDLPHLARAVLEALRAEPAAALAE